MSLRLAALRAGGPGILRLAFGSAGRFAPADAPATAAACSSGVAAQLGKLGIAKPFSTGDEGSDSAPGPLDAGPKAPAGGDTAKGKTDWRAWIDTQLTDMEEKTAAQQPTSASGAVPPGSDSKPSAAAQDSVAPAPPPTATLEPLAHPNFGYSALGAVGRGRPGAETDTMPPRINPNRLFYPNQTYQPADLNPFLAHDNDALARRAPYGPRPNSDEVELLIDFKDRHFLSKYVSEHGQLLPRRRTRLRKKTHRKVMKAVKLARWMALLPPTAKLPMFSKQKNPYSRRVR